jgi:hypothetical protein
MIGGDMEGKFRIWFSKKEEVISKNEKHQQQASSQFD